MMIKTSKNRRILRRRKTGVKEDVSGIRTVFNKIGARFLLVFLLLITFFSGYAAGVDSFSVSSASGGYEDNQVIWTELSNLGVGVVLAMAADTSDEMMPLGGRLHDTLASNSIPTRPDQPEGTSSGCRVGESHEYSTSAKDQDDDRITYTFEWGDKSSDNTVGPLDSGAEASANHIWTKPGTYKVRVRATDSRGAESGWSTVLEVTIENTPPDKPGAPSGPPLGQPEIAYTYYASTTDPNGDQITYVFDWGDGTTSGTYDVGSGETVSRLHAWDKFGEYSVRVNATDSNGASSDWSEPWVVVVGTEEQIPPVAIIAAAPMELIEGETVSFGASESSGGNGEIVSYDWDFDDGSTGTGVNVEHTYARSGQYTATLMVTDNDGLSATNGVSITVDPLDPPNMRPTVTHAKINLDEGETSVTFEGSGVDDDGEVVECRWIFPDGQIRLYSGNPVSFTLEDPPTGTYRFAVKDDDGAWSEEDEVHLFDTGGGGGGDLLPIIALMAIAAIVAVVYWYFRRRPTLDSNNGDEFGSISATSRPDGATVLLDGAAKGKSSLQMDAVLVGHHIVLFTKSGYSDCEKKAVVTANETTPIHCDLETKAPEVKLVLSAEPVEIPADGKSKSVITISTEDENGTLAPVPEDAEIVLETNIGLIDTPVRIPAGDAQTTSILTSSTAGGTATVRAKSGTGLGGSVAVRFA